MIDPTDAASAWARRLATLRKEAARRSRGAAPTDLTEEALSMCEALIRELAGAQLTHDRLRADLRIAEGAWDHLFEVMPSAGILTDRAGSIVNANRAASVLLNVSAAYLKGRDLLLFSEDRETFRMLVQELDRKRGAELRAQLLLRPRERKPTAIQLYVTPYPGRDNAWLWIVTPLSGAGVSRSLEIALPAHEELGRFAGLSRPGA
jgi:PAS domain-containing protein